MARMLLSPRRLSCGLAAQHFTLCRECAVTKEIGFSRSSSLPRLFEQIQICGQGSRGEAVYAMTTVSASPDWIDDECIAIVDRDLMYLLENDHDRHWTVLADAGDAERWEMQLIQLADEACVKTARKYGPPLVKRLGNEFAILDRYVDHIGDMRSIFDSEFSFINEAGIDESRLVDLWSIGKSEDWILAAHILIRHAPEFVASSNSMFDSRLHESPRLRTLLYLLTDHVAACRIQHAMS